MVTLRHWPVVNHDESGGDGRVIYITFSNDKPDSRIPALLVFKGRYILRFPFIIVNVFLTCDEPLIHIGFVLLASNT